MLNTYGYYINDIAININTQAYLLNAQEDYTNDIARYINAEDDILIYIGVFTNQFRYRRCETRSVQVETMCTSSVWAKYTIFIQVQTMCTSFKWGKHTIFIQVETMCTSSKWTKHTIYIQVQTMCTSSVSAKYTIFIQAERRCTHRLYVGAGEMDDGNLDAVCHVYTAYKIFCIFVGNLAYKKALKQFSHNLKNTTEIL